MPQTSFSKKTKAEIIEEYSNLLEKYDELKTTARFVHEPQSLELFERTKDYTAENLTASISELKNTLGASLAELIEKITQEAKKFNELQQAVELSKKNLELQYHIQVAANTLEQLVEEHETKKREFDKELAIRRLELEDTVHKEKREWERTKEEQEYAAKLKQRRDEELSAEEKTRKEKELEEREERLASQEADVENLKARVQEFPAELEKALSQSTQELSKQLQERSDREKEAAKRDWQAEKNIYELRVENLQTQLKKQAQDITVLQQEAERANKKAQELAVKIIESGSRASQQTEEERKLSRNTKEELTKA